MVDARRLQGRYRLDDRLAAGGMGAVYSAHDERLGRKVAVKLLKHDLAHDVRFVERFRREARAVASLGHPNIANVFDYGEDDDTPFIVMEFAPGADLARVLREEGALEPDRAAHLAAQVCAALAHAHAAGIVHRDIKPGNIIIDPGNRVKVTDFGIARAAGDSTLTATGSVLGTAHYLSPEQAGGRDIGAASDLYSLGIVLYEMLTGSVPFTADTPIAIAMRHVSDPVPLPSHTNPDVPPALDEVVARATAKDPSARFRDAEEMGAALAAARRGESFGAAATVAMGAAPVATEQLSRTQQQQEIWPAPAHGWDSRRIGRALLISFIALGLIAAALLAWRVLAGDDTNRGERRAAEEPQPADEETEEADEASPSPPQPDVFVIPEWIVGMHKEDAEQMLKDEGLKVKHEDVESDETKDTVVDTSPPPGSEVEEEDEITLVVSKGPEEEKEGPPEVPPGQDKKDEEDA